MIAGILKALARKALKERARKNIVQGNYWESAIGDQSRLPEAIEFFRGYAKRQPMENYLASQKLTPDELAKLPTHVDTIPLRKQIREGKGIISNLFRGETLYPDAKYISKTGLESKAGVKPGQWWSAEPFESAHYAIRPSKGAMGSDIANPGVIRRMKMNKDIKDMGSMRNRGTGMTHFHPPQDMIDNSKISMFYSVINRLREMGRTDAQIFKYIGQIMKKKNAAGKRDWMLYNSGGKV